jgi:UPF0755 protein
VGVLAGFLLLGALAFTLPAPGFSAQTINIPSGFTAKQAADRLADKGVVADSLLLRLPLRLRDQAVVAGRYKFAAPQGPLAVSRRLTNGEYGMPQASVVIPEGFDRTDIANRLADNLKNITTEKFMQASVGSEGYLFPDTYRFDKTENSAEVVEKMRENFRAHIDDLKPQIEQFSHSQKEIIKMASLVEKEAADYRVRRKIAGVLWSRLEKGMPLQADAVFTYLLDKPSGELTQQDLQIDSPYNLYQNTDLPPTPIANPGLEAIKATIHPIRTDDLYYLTGDDGEFHFAETLKKHNENKRRYIGE